MRDGKNVILIVDDDSDIRATLRLVLEKGGYVVDAAANAREGLQLYKSGNPDLAIVDLMMEEVDSGANLVKEIRARGGQLPVYLLSSVGDSLYVSIDAAELGLSGVFQKPIDPKSLLTTLDARLAGRV